MEFNLKDRTFIVGIAAFIFTIGLLIGYGSIKFGTEETIAALQSDNELAHEQIENYESKLADNYKQLAECQENLIIEQNNNKELQDKLLVATYDLDTLKSDEYELVNLGEFKITYYCDQRYDHICGGNGITKSGKPTEVGVTAAADWSVLPKGSIVYIEGIGFREIQDVGGAVKSNHIDVLVRDHSEALKLGVDTESVWILVKKTS